MRMKTTLWLLVSALLLWTISYLLTLVYKNLCYGMQPRFVSPLNTWNGLLSLTHSNGTPLIYDSENTKFIVTI